MFDIFRKKTVNKTFRFPVDLLSRLETLAGQKNVPLSSVVMQACEYSLKSLMERQVDCREISLEAQIQPQKN